CGLIDEKDQKNCACANDVKNRDDRISKCFIWTLCIRAFPAKQKQSRDCENVKNQGSRDYVIEQIDVKIAIADKIAGAICFNCPREHENTGPNSLNNQRPRRDMVFIQFTNPPEKKTVTRHRIIGTRTGENQSIIATEGRNHNRHCHDRRPGAWKDYVGSFRSDTIAWSILDRGERKRRQISDVRQEIKSDNQKRAEGERQRYVAPRFLHFSGDERDVVPRVR